MGVSRGNKNVGCGTWKRRFFGVGHRKTEPGGYFCWKLTLTRTPDPIRPTRRRPDFNRPTNGKKQVELWPRGVYSGSFFRTPPETIRDSRTEFNRILCASKSETAVTSNKKMRCIFKLTTDKHEASRGLSVTAELLVFLVSLYARCFHGPRAQAVEPILMRDTPTDAYSRRVVPFGG